MYLMLLQLKIINSLMVCIWSFKYTQKAMQTVKQIILFQNDMIILTRKTMGRSTRQLSRTGRRVRTPRRLSVIIKFIVE